MEQVIIRYLTFFLISCYSLIVLTVFLFLKYNFLPICLGFVDIFITISGPKFSHRHDSEPDFASFLLDLTETERDTFTDWQIRRRSVIVADRLGLCDLDRAAYDLKKRTSVLQAKTLTISCDIWRELERVFVSSLPLDLVSLLLPCRIINISYVCSHRPYRGHNKPGWKCKRWNGTFRLDVSQGDKSFSVAARLLTQTRQQRRRRRKRVRRRRRGFWGRWRHHKLSLRQKGSPWLKTQLRSLFLALISQVWWKFAAEAFISRVCGESECDWMRGEEKKEKKKERRTSWGMKRNAESARSAPLFMQHNMLTHLFQRFLRNPDYGFALVIDSPPLRRRTRLHVWLDLEDYLA